MFDPTYILDDEVGPNAWGLTKEGAWAARTAGIKARRAREIMAAASQWRGEHAELKLKTPCEGQLRVFYRALRTRADIMEDVFLRFVTVILERNVWNHRNGRNKHDARGGHGPAGTAKSQ